MTRSEQLFAEAQRHIPGGVNSPVRAFRGVGGTPIFFKRGTGAWLYDEDERRYRNGDGERDARGFDFYWFCGWVFVRVGTICRFRDFT